MLERFLMYFSCSMICGIAFMLDFRPFHWFNAIFHLDALRGRIRRVLLLLRLLISVL